MFDFMKTSVKKMIMAAVMLGFLLFGYFKIKRYFEIDSCLDKGGKWNYQTCKCEIP